MSKSKGLLTRMGNNKDIIEPLLKLLYKSKEISVLDAEYLYTIAHLLIEEHNTTNDESMFLIEYAYFIIAKTSIKTNDYRALYDFSLNYGYYPIARKIISLNLIENPTLNHIITNQEIDIFNDGEKVVTYEQDKVFNSVLKDASKGLVFLAPTSYGKSEIIFKHLKANDENNFVGIIVPTKALINQVYLDARQKINNRKIIMHDQNFDKDDDLRVLAIVTQERALRLVDDGLIFDMLYIDEAHELLRFNFGDKLNNRSLLLARLINISKKLNPKLKELYLSPVVESSKSLTMINSQELSNHKIEKDLKVLNINYLNRNNKHLFYDRYLGTFIDTEDKYDIFEYINLKSKHKNLHFLYRPVFIERYAEELYENLPVIDEEKIPKEIMNLSQELKEIIHPHFKLADYILKGFMYLHGDIPQLIKNYLMKYIRESKYIEHVVANSVILAGMNLPIDNMFYFSGYTNTRDLWNLVGRVNRLNEIFAKDNQDLNKIFIPIHFLESDKYPVPRGKGLKNTIELFRKKRTDIIKNPMLENAKIDKSNNEAAEEIKNIEFRLLDNYHNLKFRDKLLKAGAQQVMNYTERGLNILELRLKQIDKTTINNENIIERASEIFLKNYQKESDYQPEENITRLKNEAAISYYTMFVEDMNKLNFKARVNKTVSYWKRKQEIDSEYISYIGSKYGEVKRDYREHREKYFKVKDYIKDDRTLYNMAIIKLQLDEDFVSYNITLLLNTMLEFEIIDQSQFDLFIYGTNAATDLKILRLGLSRIMYRALKENNLINEIKFDNYGNVKGNNKIEEYINKQKGIYKFELKEFFNIQDSTRPKI